MTGLERSHQIPSTRRSAATALRNCDRYGLLFTFCYTADMLVQYNVTVFRTISTRRIAAFQYCGV